LKKDNVYRVTLEVEVMLSDPKSTASTVKMNEYPYNSNIPKLTKEARFLFTKTTQVQKSIRNRRSRTHFTADDIKRLCRRYIVIAKCSV